MLYHAIVAARTILRKLLWNARQLYLKLQPKRFNLANRLPVWACIITTLHFYWPSFSSAWSMSDRLCCNVSVQRLRSPINALWRMRLRSSIQTCSSELTDDLFINKASNEITTTHFFFLASTDCFRLEMFWSSLLILSLNRSIYPSVYASWSVSYWNYLSTCLISSSSSETGSRSNVWDCLNVNGGALRL